MYDGSSPLLLMQGIDKQFSGVPVLRKCRFELRGAEVHALVGENGAGKSTMMKILTGIYERDDGEILYKGAPVAFHTAKQAQDAGIHIVHQELNMMNHLTVAQNIFIGREGKGPFLRDAEINRRAAALFDRLGIAIDPQELVGNLTVGRQQMVEIAKAISFDSSIVVFDEPTAALTDVEIEHLFRVMNDLRAQGVAMVYISHRMMEIKRITDRITVMRDGETVGTRDTADVEMDEIIHMMVGRTVFEAPKESSTMPPGAPVLLSARHLTSVEVRDVSFDLHRGEILGFAGLMGAGRTETARLLFGADRMHGGEILLDGKRVSIRSPQDAVRLGIGYLSEDRKQYGLCLGLSVSLNTVLTSLDRFTRRGLVDDAGIDRTSREYVQMLNVKTPSTAQLAKNLSGGNQQKVVIAKWLLRDCDILIFDEPTRGIDVGAKSEIYRLMSELAQQGKAIIMISSDMPELLRMSDRVLVMCEGRVTGTLPIEEASPDAIMRLATAH